MSDILRLLDKARKNIFKAQSDIEKLQAQLETERKINAELVKCVEEYSIPLVILTDSHHELAKETLARVKELKDE